MLIFEYKCVKDHLIKSHKNEFRLTDVDGQVHGFISTATDGITPFKTDDGFLWIAFEYVDGVARFFGYKDKSYYLYTNVLDLYKFLLKFEERDFMQADLQKLQQHS